MINPKTGREMSFFEVVTAAVNDIAEHGFDSAERVANWLKELRLAAERDLTPPHVLEEALRRSFGQAYEKLVEQGDLLRNNEGVSRFTLQKVKPALRAELDRRILASANLIVRNRGQAIEDTLKRFEGWATSIPVGGDPTVEKLDTKAAIRKSLVSLPFEERRVIIDQGHKFEASLSEILATDGGALAAEWESKWRQPGYNYRKDHKDRDGKFYAVRGNWALQKGMMKAGPAGYTDQLTKPGQEVYCSCRYRYIYRLRDLPPELLTQKGAAELARVRDEIRGTA